LNILKLFELQISGSLLQYRFKELQNAMNRNLEIKKNASDSYMAYYLSGLV